MKRYIKTALLLLVAYCVFCFISCQLPNKIIRHNIERSVLLGDISSDYPRAIVNREVCRMDNVTDALILNQSYMIDRSDLLTSILLLPSKGGEMRDVDALNKLINSEPQPMQYYPRYWHGSTFLMRYFLLFGRYANVRLFLYYITSLLFVLLCCLLYNKSGFGTVFAFVSSAIFMRLYVLQFSIQFAPVLIISFVASIYLLNSNQIKRHSKIIFFITGSLTSFFDLLTTPLLTLCIPLIVFFVKKKNDEKEYRLFDNLKKITSFSALWGVGYLGTWLLKWIIASLLTSHNVIKDGFVSSLYRISGKLPNNDFSMIDVWGSVFSKTPLIWILILVGLLLIIGILFLDKKNIKQSIVFVVIAFFPLVWITVLGNHTYVHSWFVYRVLMITFCSTQLALLSLIDKHKLCVTANRYRYVYFNHSPRI